MISVLIPIAENTNLKLIKRCLKSLAKQTYKDFEVLIITSPSYAKKIIHLAQEYPFIKIFKKNLGKGAARNFLAQKARGKYLYHLDIDMAPTSQVLAECHQKATTGTEAMIIPDKETPSKSFMSRCRALERRLLQDSQTVVAPLFLKKSLFQKAGGYDKNLDPADDWNLHLTLKKMGVKPGIISAPVIVKEFTSLKKALKKKYRMGQIYPALKKKYPSLPYSNLQERLKDYLRNWQELIKSPLAALCLLFLKIADFVSFFWGILHPPRPENRYTLTKIAQEYEQKRLGSNFGRYKHFIEIKSLLRLLPRKKIKILEIGCGTGRITENLVKEGFKVTPIDASTAMLGQYRQKKTLPKPQLVEATQLPFEDDSFPLVCSLRVIWHLPKKKIGQMLAEAARVSSQIVILDITNKKRWPKIYRDRYPHEYFFTWEEFTQLTKHSKLRIDQRIPLDTLAPFWLNLLPQKLATDLFPLVYRLDLLSAKIIPPGRYLVKLSLV